MYNTERPHEALQHAVPIERYKKSLRSYPEILPTVEYEKGFIIRKVQQGGLIHLNGDVYRIGSAFYGQPVGIKEAEDGLLDVYFCHQKINKIDPRYPYQQ